MPHRLYGHVPPRRRYSVGAWLDDIAAVLRRGEARRTRWPSSVGGTGLYFKALTEGLAAIPDIPAGRRGRIGGAACGARASRALHAALAATRSGVRRGDPAERSAARPARAGSARGDRPTARRMAERRRSAAAAAARRDAAASSSRPTARRSTGGSRSASTAWWRRARWTRSRRLLAREPRSAICRR